MKSYRLTGRFGQKNKNLRLAKEGHATPFFSFLHVISLNKILLVFIVSFWLIPGQLDFGLIQRKPGVTNYEPQNAVYTLLINRKRTIISFLNHMV